MGLILILVVIGIVVWLVFQRSDIDPRIVSRSSSPEGRTEETPLEILNKRYARGEIDKVEYEERKRGLL